MSISVGKELNFASPRALVNDETTKKVIHHGKNGYYFLGNKENLTSTNSFDKKFA